MNRLQPLFKVTKQLKDTLDETDHANNRETVIDDVNDLVDKREALMDQIKPPFTEDEKRLGQEIVELNNQIQEKMDTLFSDIKSDMKQMKQQKKSNRSYTKPYENVKAADGMFMDSKN